MRQIVLLVDFMYSKEFRLRKATCNLHNGSLVEMLDTHIKMTPVWHNFDGDTGHSALATNRSTTTSRRERPEAKDFEQRY